jgi:hypothetical protein
LDRKPGLTTRTLSTTCADLSGIMQLKRARATYLCKRR